MPVSDVVSISIAVSGPGPTATGFGEPLIAAYHTHYTDRVREYTSLAGMVSDGFSTSEPAYLIASNVMAQTPSPTAFKIGRCQNTFTQVLNLTCLSTSNLDTYKFSLFLPGGSLQTLSIASTGVPATDVVTINTAVTALAISGLTATHSGAILVLTMTAGKMIGVIPDVVHMSFLDATTDPGGSTGLANDLEAIQAADNNWYQLLLDCEGAARIAVAATFINGQTSPTYIFGWGNSDTASATSASTTDVFYLQQQTASTRSFGIFLQGNTLAWPAAAWAGRLLPTTPGAENWAYKTLVGPPVDTNLTTSQIHAIEAKNGTVYTPLFGIPLTQFGKVAGGTWIDQTRGQDALVQAIQIAIVVLQANNIKIPYTAAGIAQYQSTIDATLQQFVTTGFLASNPAPIVSVPNLNQISLANLLARNLPLVSFSATLASAINSVTISGVLLP